MGHPFYVNSPLVPVYQKTEASFEPNWRIFEQQQTYPLKIIIFFLSLDITSFEKLKKVRS